MPIYVVEWYIIQHKNTTHSLPVSRENEVTNRKT